MSLSTYVLVPVEANGRWIQGNWSYRRLHKLPGTSTRTYSLAQQYVLLIDELCVQSMDMCLLNVISAMAFLRQHALLEGAESHSSRV